MSCVHRSITMVLAAVLALGCLLAPCGIAQRPTAGQEPSQEVLTVGAWNIRLLGSPSQTSPQEAKDLAKYIDFAKVDILALEEITPTGPAPDGFEAPFETSKILDDVFAQLNKMQGAKWRHILFPAFFVDPKEGKKQWVGVAWNENKVQPVKTPVKLMVSNELFQTGDVKENLWKRNAHAMMFTAGKDKTDFVLIPVHMKSNKGGQFRAHREAEAKELVKHLPELNDAFPGEKDIVILGDTNFLKDDDEKEAAREILIQAKFKDLNAADDTTHLGGGKAPFDRFFVPNDQPEFKQSSQKILREFLKQEGLTQKQFVQRFSDHLMIVTQIQIMKDDD